MNTMKSPSRSPQSLKRERDDEDDFESPLNLRDNEGLTTGEVDDSNLFQTTPCAPDCGASNSFSTPLRTRTTNFKTDSNNTNSPSANRASSPARSSTGSLSDAGTSTPIGLRPSPSTAFTALNGIVEPPKKRAKLTFAEREEQRILKAVKDQQKAEERAQREIDKKAKEEDRVRREAEKEADRRKREAEREEKRLAKEVERIEKEEKRQIKEAERAEKEKEKKAKEDERKRKEEEKQKIEEEKRKKEKSQPKLNAFFKKPVATSDENNLRKSPSPAPKDTPNTSTAKPSSKIDSMTDYQKKFPPFFVQNYVTVASFTKFSRDERASDALQDAIDSCINSQQSHKEALAFDPVRLFNLPNFDTRPRGKRITPVRHIMSQILGNAKQPIDLTTDSQNMKIKNTRNQLRKIPYKVLSFAEDVRPPYKGTYTSQPKSGMRKLARNPIRRDLPNVNYDYDSEAEWEDDDGEDVESDCNDEEEIGDAGDDLEEFLDDAEAETLNARKLVMQGDLEPKCSGLCWEDQNRRGPALKMYRYLMEFITADIQTPIDPFATQYWDTPTPTGLMDPPRVPLNTIKSINTGLNGPNNKDAANLAKPTLSQKLAIPGSKSSSHPKKSVSVADMPAFKEAIQGSELSKIGLIEVLNKQFPKISKNTIKHTLELIAKRVGAKEAEKKWVLIDETKD